MPESPLTPDVLRRTAEDLSHVPADELRAAARVVGEVLLAQAEQRAPGVSHALVDTRVEAAGVTAAVASTRTGKPLEVLRSGARNTSERALVAVLFAHHVGALLDRRDGVHAVRAALPCIDWLEFEGLYPPYTAARHVLDADVLARFDELLRAAPADGPTALASAATRALRGLPLAPAPASPSPGAPAPRERSRAGVISLAGEVEGWHRPAVLRFASVVTGWAFVRGVALGALRVVFSFRRPATVTLDGNVLRVAGHSEVLGRTLRTFDVRYPVANLVEVRREARFPMLPAAASVFALSVGAIFGARSVVEGARAVYFPLIGLGLGLLAGGVLFDLVVRALFPGVKGRTRMTVRSHGARAVVLTELAPDDVQRLLHALDARLAEAPARPARGVTAREDPAEGAPGREPPPPTRSRPEVRPADAGRG